MIVFQLIGLSIAVFLLIHSMKQIGLIKVISVSFSIFIILATFLLMIFTLIRAHKYRGMMYPPNPQIMKKHCGGYQSFVPPTTVREVILLKIPNNKQGCPDIKISNFK